MTSTSSRSNPGTPPNTVLTKKFDAGLTPFSACRVSTTRVASACGAETQGPSTSQAPVPMFYGCNEAQVRQKSTERAQAPRVGPGSSQPLTRPPAEPKFRSCDQTSRSVLQKS